MKTTQFKREAAQLFTPAYQDTICHEQPDIISSKQLKRKFTSLLKTLFPDCEIVNNGGYCYCSGFVSKDGKTVYINISDLRFWKNWANDILIRTARDTKDFTGGPNNYTTIENLQANVYKMLDRGW